MSISVWLHFEGVRENEDDAKEERKKEKVSE